MMMRMRQAFRFCTFKCAIMNEIKVPALNGDLTKNNMIWLHGMFDSSKTFVNMASDDQLRRLTNSFLLDARNHGDSEHCDSHSFEELSYDLVDYIANRDMKDIYLLGHSMGGRTIMTAMRDHKAFLEDRVKGVIIVDILPRSYDKESTGPTV